MASFGVGIDDLIAVGTLAWTVYRACSNASYDFRDVSREVESLQSAVTAIQKHFPSGSIRSRLDEDHQERLRVILRNCEASLKRLSVLVEQYGSLGAESSKRKKRDVTGFAAQDLAAMRHGIAVHVNAVNVFLSGLGEVRLGRIESRLDEIVQEIRKSSQHRTGSVLTDRSDETFAETQWASLEADLLKDGFTRTVLEPHKQWFTSRLEQAVLFDSDIPDIHAPLEPTPDIRARTPKADEEQYQVLFDYEPRGEADELLILQGEIVLAQSEDWYVDGSDLWLKCTSVDGKRSGYLPSTELAKTNSSGKADAGERLLPRVYRAPETAPSTNKTPIRGRQTRRSSPLPKAVEPAPELAEDSRPVPQNQNRATSKASSRASSKARSVRSAVSEYDSDGRLVKHKSVTTTMTTWSTGEPTPPLPRNNSAPDHLGRQRSLSEAKRSTKRLRKIRQTTHKDSSTQTEDRPSVQEQAPWMSGASYDAIENLLKIRTRQLGTLFKECARSNLTLRTQLLHDQYSHAVDIDKELEEIHNSVTNLHRELQTMREREQAQEPRTFQPISSARRAWARRGLG